MIGLDEISDLAEQAVSGSVAFANDPTHFEDQITMTPQQLVDFFPTLLKAMCPHETITRRPLDDDQPAFGNESDRDFFVNNQDAVLWFLDQMGAEPTA